MFTLMVLNILIYFKQYLWIFIKFYCCIPPKLQLKLFLSQALKARILLILNTETGP